MPDLSEFVSFVAEKSRIRNTSLIAKDVILHRILAEVNTSALSKKHIAYSCEGHRWASRSSLRQSGKG